MQMSMFDILEPKPKPKAWTMPPRRTIQTRAYGRDHSMEINEEDPDPVEMVIRGMPCLVTLKDMQTFTLGPVGSLFWSSTGFRSFGRDFTNDPEAVAATVERFIDGPTKDGGGLGGKLERWWPSYVSQWQQNEAFARSQKRETTWEQWGPEKHVEMWQNHDTKQAEALSRMVAEGIDPNDIGKPSHFKGNWPKFGPNLFSH
jgi:hypothetical protein